MISPVSSQSSDNSSDEAKSYESYIEFIRNDVQSERRTVNRQMLSVFVWCFFLPACFTVIALIFIKSGWLPRSMRSHLDWLVLVFPVCYSIYFLSSQVLVDIPTAFRHGSIAITLGQSVKEGKWRARVCSKMQQELALTPSQWSWVIMSYKMDIERMQNRNRYLTALAGAVFFLILQGIDSIGGATEEKKVTWIKDSVLGWIESSGQDLSQFVALGLFLLLLYLSGNQTIQILQRYLNCAELLRDRFRSLNNGNIK